MSPSFLKQAMASVCPLPKLINLNEIVVIAHILKTRRLVSHFVTCLSPHSAAQHLHSTDTALDYSRSTNNLALRGGGPKSHTDIELYSVHGGSTCGPGPFLSEYRGANTVLESLGFGSHLNRSLA